MNVGKEFDASLPYQIKLLLIRVLPIKIVHRNKIGLTNTVTCRK